MPAQASANRTEAPERKERVLFSMGRRVLWAE